MTQLSKLIKKCGAANVVSPILLLLFWFLFALLLPYRELSTTLVILVEDSDWLFVNLLGLSGAIVGLAGYVGLHLWQIERSGKLGMAALSTGFVGMVMLCGQLIWETFIWKILVTSHPTIFEFQGPLYSSPLFLGVAGTGGLLYSIGFVLTGLMLFKQDLLRVPALLVLIGAPLFGMGALAGGLQVTVRSVGIVFFAAGLSWIGIRQWSSQLNETIKTVSDPI